MVIILSCFWSISLHGEGTGEILYIQGTTEFRANIIWTGKSPMRWCSRAGYSAAIQCPHFDDVTNWRLNKWSTDSADVNPWRLQVQCQVSRASRALMCVLRQDNPGSIPRRKKITLKKKKILIYFENIFFDILGLPSKMVY